MSLPPRIPKKQKRASRWRSQAHCNHVRSHACSGCGIEQSIEVAHVRVGSGAGTGQKPDDWRAVSLCKWCHQSQHSIGERTFWGEVDVEALVEHFIRTSPKRAEIEQVRRDRA